MAIPMSTSTMSTRITIGITTGTIHGTKSGTTTIASTKTTPTFPTKITRAGPITQDNFPRTTILTPMIIPILIITLMDTIIPMITLTLIPSRILNNTLTLTKEITTFNSTAEVGAPIVVARS